MAIAEQIICQKCQQVKTVWYGGGQAMPRVCHECAGKDADEQKQAHLKGLAQLSIEERVAKIEEQLYDQSQAARRRDGPDLY